MLYVLCIHVHVHVACATVTLASVQQAAALLSEPTYLLLLTPYYSPRTTYYLLQAAALLSECFGRRARLSASLPFAAAASHCAVLLSVHRRHPRGVGWLCGGLSLLDSAEPSAGYSPPSPPPRPPGLSVAAGAAGAGAEPRRTEAEAEAAEAAEGPSALEAGLLGASLLEEVERERRDRRERRTYAPHASAAGRGAAPPPRHRTAGQGSGGQSSMSAAEEAEGGEVRMTRARRAHAVHAHAHAHAHAHVTCTRACNMHMRMQVCALLLASRRRHHGACAGPPPLPSSPLCWLLADALAETAVVYAAARLALATPCHPHRHFDATLLSLLTQRTVGALSTDLRTYALLHRSLWVHFDSLATLPLLRAASQLSGTRYAAAVPRVRHGDLAHADAPDLAHADLPPGAAEAGEPALQREKQQQLKIGALEDSLAEARAELAVARQGRRADAVPPAVPHAHRTSLISAGLG